MERRTPQITVLRIAERAEHGVLRFILHQPPFQGVRPHDGTDLPRAQPFGCHRPATVGLDVLARENQQATPATDEFSQPPGVGAAQRGDVRHTTSDVLFRRSGNPAAGS